jgi:hypothetical protein
VQNAWRIAVAGAMLVAAAVLFFVLRPGDETADPAPAADTGAATTEETAPTETAPTGTGSDGGPTTQAAPPPNTFRIDVPAGGPTNVPRLDVKRGEQVTIIVTLGTHEDVHLHGYDLLLHTGPGLPPARFRFRASTPGSFGLEMEQSHRQIAELRVT